MKKIALLLLVTLMLGVCLPVTGSAAKPEDGAYIVKLKETAPDTVRLLSNVDAYEISENAGLYRVDSYADVLRLGDRVEYYEPEVQVELLALTNDKYSDYQWNLENISVQAAWNAGYTGQGVRVAIVDSGISSAHEDLAGVNIEKGYNVLNGSTDVSDSVGHGTFIAGTIAAVANNGLGIAGICDKVTIIPIKCFGDSATMGSSYIVSAIYAAVDNYKCDVMNLSLGAAGSSNSMRDAVRYAISKGVLVVAASGNDGTSELNYPAAYPNVIGVGSINSNGMVSSFSQKNQSVFVTAPGEGLVGLGNASNDAYVPKTRGSGTSYAVPHVVAAAAILKQFHKSAKSEDFQKILISSVKDAGDVGYDTSYGYGTLDLAGFITAMESYEFNLADTFPDIAGHWALDGITLCVKNGYFNGVSESSFAPEALMTRAMFVTALSRVSGEEISGYANVFTDVPDSAYYAQPCGWGNATGIVQGTSASAFSPGVNVTREQMAVLLYRYATVYGLISPPDGSSDSLGAFSDASKVASYARQAMGWAVENGLITGRTSTTLVPGGSASRAEVATIIARFVRLYTTLDKAA